MVTEYVCFWGKCDVTCRYIDVFARLTHWLSDYMRQEMDCKVVLFLLTYLRMFNHVYFVLKLVLMWRRWSVHLCLVLLHLLNWGVTAICHSRLNSAKTAFIVWILQYNGHKLKPETLFHIKSTKAQCLLRFIGWEVPFNVLSINWNLARLIDSLFYGTILILKSQESICVVNGRNI